MKRVFLGLIVVFLFTGCGSKTSGPTAPTTPTPAPTPTPTPTPTPAVTLKSVAVTGQTEMKGRGSKQQLTAKAAFSDGSEQDVTADAEWVAAIPGVLTVDKGLVTTVSFGSSLVTAVYKSVSGTIMIKVSDLSATRVDFVGGGTMSITGLNQTVQIKTQARFDDGSSREVTAETTWEDSNPGVASISAAGLLTTKATGQTKITCTFQGLHAELVVTVSVPGSTPTPTPTPGPTPGPGSTTFTAVSVGQCGYGQFLKNGASFYQQYGCKLNGGRGFNVAVADASGNVLDARSFDTYLDVTGGNNGASAALVSYLGSQPAGRVVMVAVGDEAGLTLPPYLVGGPCGERTSQEPIYRALESLGAKQIRPYCYWDAYVLISVVGQGAKAEQLGSPAGMAQVSYTLP